ASRLILIVFQVTDAAWGNGIAVLLNASSQTERSKLLVVAARGHQHIFVLEETWPAVAHYRPTYINAVPTILSRLLEGPEPRRRRLNARRCALLAPELRVCPSRCSGDSRSAWKFQ